MAINGWKWMKLTMKMLNNQMVWPYLSFVCFLFRLCSTVKAAEKENYTINQSIVHSSICRAALGFGWAAKKCRMIWNLKYLTMNKEFKILEVWRFFFVDFFGGAKKEEENWWKKREIYIYKVTITYLKEKCTFKKKYHSLENLCFRNYF